MLRNSFQKNERALHFISCNDIYSASVGQAMATGCQAGGSDYMDLTHDHDSF